MELREFVKAALRKVAQKVKEGSLDKHEQGYDDSEEMLLDWIWIELKEESPDKDAVINMDLDDLFEVIEGSADMFEDYQILLDNIRSDVR